jgi:hypothetical protein
MKILVWPFPSPWFDKLFCHLVSPTNSSLKNSYFQNIIWDLCHIHCISHEAVTDSLCPSQFDVPSQSLSPFCIAYHDQNIHQPQMNYWVYHHRHMNTARLDRKKWIQCPGQETSRNDSLQVLGVKETSQEVVNGIHLTCTCEHDWQTLGCIWVAELINWATSGFGGLGVACCL